jgi:hypothetical protein
MDDSFYAFDAPKYKIPDDRSLGLQDPLPSELLSSGGQSSDDVGIAAGGGVDQDTFYTGPFSIKINGSYDETDEGIVSQSSSFNITVQQGTAKYPNASAITVGGESDSVSAFNSMYRIYASVKGTRNDEDGPVDTYSDATIHINESGGEAVGSNTRFETDNNRDYIFYFLIGSVTTSKNGDGNWVIRVNQIQVGNYSYGETNGTSSDTNGNDTRGGQRRVTICINGKPYYADVELNNLIAV